MDWRKTRDQLSQSWSEAKSSQQAAFELVRLYDDLSDSDRLAANREMAGWLIDEDSSLRYDAAFVISSCSIVGMVCHLERAIDWLKDLDGPGPQFEIKKLKRIIDGLV